jgi:hypothetical protein
MTLSLCESLLHSREHISLSAATYWRFERGFELAHLDYYSLEILCLIAWVITLTALLPFFAFINNEFAGNLS